MFSQLLRNTLMNCWTFSWLETDSAQAPTRRFFSDSWTAVQHQHWCRLLKESVHFYNIRIKTSDDRLIITFSSVIHAQNEAVDQTLYAYKSQHSNSVLQQLIHQFCEVCSSGFHTKSSVSVAEAKISGNVMGMARLWSSVDTSNAVSKHWTATDKQNHSVTCETQRHLVKTTETW